MDKKQIYWPAYGRIAVFIDAANVIYSLKDLGWRIDYKKLQKYFRSNCKLTSIYLYYSTYKDNIGQANLLEMLARKGFSVVFKEVKVIKLKNGEFLHKGNCDVELVIDVIDSIASYDSIVLLSGDSDFAALIRYIQKHGKKVISISTRNHVSREIIETSDIFILFNKFKDDWSLYLKNHKTPH